MTVYKSKGLEYDTILLSAWTITHGASTMETRRRRRGSAHDSAPQALIADINQQRQHANLSSVIRLYVLDYYVRLAKVTGKVKR
jgi:ATP-dependent exoDNAse (exonuclease V) beta subunit